MKLVCAWSPAVVHEAEFELAVVFGVYPGGSGRTLRVHTDPKFPRRQVTGVTRGCFENC